MTNTQPQGKNYEDGIREGRLLSIEHTQREHGRRLDEHSKRITAQERITYALLGALTLLQLFPAIDKLLGG